MRLREYRRRKLVSIKALAEMVGGSTRTIMDIEHGRTLPRLKTIQRLSAALDVDPMEIDEFRRAVMEEDAETEDTKKAAA